MLWNTFVAKDVAHVRCYSFVIHPLLKLFHPFVIKALEYVRCQRCRKRPSLNLFVSAGNDTIAIILRVHFLEMK